MGDAAHAMVPFYGQGMNCVSTNLTSDPSSKHTQATSIVNDVKVKTWAIGFHTHTGERERDRQRDRESVCVFTVAHVPHQSLQGFEDCIVLDQLLDSCRDDFSEYEADIADIVVVGRGILLGTNLQGSVRICRARLTILLRCLHKICFKQKYAWMFPEGQEPFCLNY